MISYGKDFALQQEQHGIVIPRGIASQRQLFEVYADKLKFPGYFGYNWNAFDECINDLSWLNRERIDIYHEDRLENLPRQDREIYLELLEEAESIVAHVPAET